MADFLTAFNITMKTEGGYNPGNGEAETYMGVDRSQNPKWSGWAIIDQIKGANKNATVTQLNVLFKANTTLQSLVQSFYKTYYWDNIGLSGVIDQQVANGLFDCSVNPCLIPVGKSVQMACNTVKQGIVKVDGQFGNASLTALNSLKPDLLLTAFNGIRVANYYERVKLSPSMVQWLSSWLGRCKPYSPVG